MDVCEVRSECVCDLALQQALLKVRVHGRFRVSMSVPEGPAGNVALGCLSAWHVPLVLLFECRWHVSSQSPRKATLVGVCGPSPAICVTCRATAWVCVGLARPVLSPVGLPSAFLRQVLATCSLVTSR